MQGMLRSKESLPMVESMMSAASLMDARFSKRAGLLERCRRSHKKATALGSYRQDWILEHKALERARRHLEVFLKCGEPCVVDVCDYSGLRSLAAATSNEAEAAAVSQALLEARRRHESIAKELDALEEEATSEAKAARKALGSALKDSESNETVDDVVDGYDVPHFFKDDDDAMLQMQVIKAEAKAEYLDFFETNKDEKTEEEESISEWDSASLRLFSEAVRGATSVAAKMERLKLAFPERSSSELGSELSRRFASKRRREAHRASAEKRRAWKVDFGLRLEKRVREAVEDFERRRVSREDAADLEARRRELHNELDRLRRQKEDADAEKMRLDASERERRQTEELTLEETKQKRLAVARDAVAAYKIAAEAARAQALQAAEAAQKRDNTLKKSRLRQNEARSAFRAQKRRQERAARDDQRRRAEAAASDARRIALENIAASLPYADALASAVADIHKPTKATIASRADQRPDPSTYLTGLSYADGSYAPHEGLAADDRLFKDFRFKLASALRDAGIAHTSAAKAIVQHHIPRLARNPILQNHNNGE